MALEVLRILANLIIALFAQEVANNQCIFGRIMMKGKWKEKIVYYVPGKITVGIKRGENIHPLVRIIETNGGEVDFITKDTIEIIVPTEKTFDVARKLDSLQVFKFVTPEILE